MNQIFYRIPNDKILHPETHPSVIFLAPKLLYGDRSQLLRDASKAFLNTHTKISIDANCNDGYPGSWGELKKRHIPVHFIVYLWFQILQITCLVHNTTRESEIKFTILGWCQAISSKSNCQVQMFPLCYSDIFHIFAGSVSVNKHID